MQVIDKTRMIWVEVIENECLLKSCYVPCCGNSPKIYIDGLMAKDIVCQTRKVRGCPPTEGRA